MLKQSKKHGLSGEEEKNSVEPVIVKSYESLGEKNGYYYAVHIRNMEPYKLVHLVRTVKARKQSKYLLSLGRSA